MPEAPRKPNEALRAVLMRPNERRGCAHCLSVRRTVMSGVPRVPYHGPLQPLLDGAAPGQ